MDLFKLYVDDLRARFHEEKKVIKEIIKDKQYEVTISTTFDEYNEIFKEDKRASLLDIANLKMVFAGLQERCELKEKERLKEENRKLKKLEQNFKNLLKKFIIDENTKFDYIKQRMCNEEAYLR